MTTTIQTLQKLTVEWGIRCFGKAHMSNKRLRALRLVEEAIELCQALGVPQSQVMHCVEVVYSRPEGVPLQELGGVLVTAAVIAEAMDTNLDVAMLMEVARVLARPVERYRLRNDEKIALGLG